MKLKKGLEPISIKILGLAFITLLVVVGTSIVQGMGNIATAIALIAAGSIIFIELQLLSKVRKKDFDFVTLVLGIIGVTVIGLGLFSLTDISLPLWIASARDYAIFIVAIALAIEVLRN